MRPKPSSEVGPTGEGAITPIQPSLPDNHPHHFYNWTDVKAERHGGPPAKCRFCGSSSKVETGVEK